MDINVYLNSAINWIKLHPIRTLFVAVLFLFALIVVVGLAAC